DTYCFLFYRAAAHRDLHSFPTRRSSDLVVRELADLIEQGHEIAEGTIAAVTSALDQHHSPSEILEDVVWRHRSTKVAPKTVNQRSEEHTSELQSLRHLVCRLLLEKKKKR